MTRKHYEILAQAINNGIAGNTVAPEGDVMAVVTEVASALKAENPRFDKVKFLKACGIS